MADLLPPWSRPLRQTSGRTPSTCSECTLEDWGSLYDRGLAFSSVIDRTKRLVTGIWSGTVRGGDVASASRTIHEDPTWQPGFDTFWEATGITAAIDAGRVTRRARVPIQDTSGGTPWRGSVAEKKLNRVM